MHPSNDCVSRLFLPYSSNAAVESLDGDLGVSLPIGCVESATEQTLRAHQGRHLKHNYLEQLTDVDSTQPLASKKLELLSPQLKS